MIEPVRIIVVSPNRIFAEVMAVRLRRVESVGVLGWGANCLDLLPPYTAHAPDVALIDTVDALEFPLQTSRKLFLLYPEVRVVALGVKESGHAMLPLFEAGVRGYVRKTDALDELLAVIESVRQGAAACSARLAACVYNRLAHLSRQRKQSRSHPLETLTPRERQVLALLSTGNRNKEIASELGIRLSTAKSHVHSVLRKLSLQHRQEAVQLQVH